MITKKDLHKISDYIWEIPKSYRSDMRVPARIYTDKKMLDQIEAGALNQVINVASIPGILKYSIAMPDIHTGYGFVIGGVAATKLPDGVISPGGIGYDQNCLSGDTKILHSLGYFLPIKKLERDRSELIKCANFKEYKIEGSSFFSFFKRKTSCVFKIVTKAGREIKATSDHPFYTPKGMVKLEKLQAGDQVAVSSFEGVPYEKPSNKIIISENDIKKILLRLGRKPGETGFDQNIRVLRQRDLLIITYDHPKLPYLLKIMGFVFGDGSMNFIGKRGDGVFSFDGKSEDLEEARKDLKKIGYTPSPIHFRRRKDARSGKYRDSYSFLVNASSLVILMEALGVPRGSKVSQPFRIPKWIFKSPLWQKRLFLAALFGSELRCPHKRLDRRGSFNAPSFPIGKRIELVDNARDYLKDIERLLKEFGVKTLYIEQPKNKRHVNTKGKVSWGLNLVVSPATKNLLNLWSKIGFEYNRERAFFANVAVQYLSLKQQVLQEKERVIKFEIPRLLKAGLSYQKTANQLATGNPLTKRFIMDVCWKLNKGVRKINPRITSKFISFKDYFQESTRDLGRCGLIWEKIERIEKIPYQNFVYDFTVNHPDHNFIANGFVVSNCGVRLLKSSYTKKEIMPHLDELATEIQRQVPSGLGRGRRFKLDIASIDKILEGGVQSLVEQGYGEKDDVENCEEKGKMEQADASTVSDHAKNRGRDQVGTLGSGNHFCSLEKVEEIFDKKTAEIFGLYKNQVVVMIHTGSRGLGHQNCTDYLRIIMQVMPKYKIRLPDRELACIPFNSPEGQGFFKAMCAACNFAWSNRHMITFYVRKSWTKVLGEKANLKLLYDVAHNIAKIEEHEVNGEKMKLIVHRKGATRAFPPGHPEIPEKYKTTGQPAIIPGTMGTSSYICAGTEKSREAWYTVNHGAGRTMSRHAAKRMIGGEEVVRRLKQKGILIKCRSMRGIAEEAPLAYKDVDHVVNIVHNAGLAKKVARLVPLAVIKGE